MKMWGSSKGQGSWSPLSMRLPPQPWVDRYPPKDCNLCSGTYLGPWIRVSKSPCSVTSPGHYGSTSPGQGKAIVFHNLWPPCPCPGPHRKWRAAGDVGVPCQGNRLRVTLVLRWGCQWGDSRWLSIHPREVGLGVGERCEVKLQAPSTCSIVPSGFTCKAQIQTYD